MDRKVVAIVLAAGQGKRMNTKVAKQYLEIRNRPLLYYTLKAFEESEVKEIILVTGNGEEEFCRTQIVEQYNFSKVTAIVAGGHERYDSVYEGLKVCNDAEYVLIHDGARPCITNSIINNTIIEVMKHQACIVAVPVKDTIKIVNQQGVVTNTPVRSSLQIVQTPQAFAYPLIWKAYENLMRQEHSDITDDAMVIEKMTNTSVYVVEGSYTNIKVTTPEDLLIAEQFLSSIEGYE